LTATLGRYIVSDANQIGSSPPGALVGITHSRFVRQEKLAMRHARNLFAATVLVLALSSSTFAGVLLSDDFPPPPPPPDTSAQATTTDINVVAEAVVTAIVLYGISWSG
jgi:hypothetical protein